jgi:hypothetical protein
MNTDEFATLFRKTKDQMLSLYARPGETAVAIRIASLNLDPTQRAEVMKALDDALTDAFYTVLMGLGGAATIGDIQQNYTITDEDGAVISRGNDGELEASAWRAFHSNKEEK